MSTPRQPATQGAPALRRAAANPVVEVGDEAEALCWQQAGADIPQLEKLPSEAVDRIRRAFPAGATTRTAAAGGTNSANAEAYARAGADILVTPAPYFAPPRDAAVTISAL